MQITRFVVNMIEENCYLLSDDKGQAALVDCGAFYPEERKAIADYIDQHKLTLTHLLNTHGHFDHLFGASFVYERYGLGPEMAEAERETYAAASEQMRQFIHRDLPLTTPPVARWLHDGDTVKVGDITLEVIATPGHTPGGICFYCAKEGVLFSGDSLFHHEIGRCDLPGGDLHQLITALKTRILPLPDTVKVLPGHGEATTIGDERANNPYLQ